MSEPKPTKDPSGTAGRQPLADGMLRASGTATIMLAVALGGSLALYLFALRVHRFGAYHDDGIYVATAKALAEGQGYRIISLPYEPAQTKYPPFYPFLLSLIWRAYPEFPQNLPWMMLLSVIATLSSLLMAWKYLVRGNYATPWQALIIVAMTALSWRTMILATSVYSEMVYAALSISALFLAEKYENSARRWGPGLILGVLIGLTFLTRSSGIALPVAIAAYFVVRKKWRKALLPIGVAALFVLGWIAWCYVNKTTAGGVNAPYYTSYLGHLNQIVQALQEQNRSSRLGIFVNIVVENFVAGVLIAVPLVCSGFGYGTLAGIGGFLLVICVLVLCLILLLAVTGFVRTITKGIRLLHVYVVACMALNLFWLPGISPDRFLMPFLPLLLFFLVSEVTVLASLARRGLQSAETGRRLSGAFVALILVAIMSTTLYGYISGIRSSLSSLDASAARAAEDAEAMAWIREHTDRSDVLASYRDPKLFLYTGHKAVREFPMSGAYPWEDDPASIEKLSEGVFRVFEEARARYLIVTSTDFELEDRPAQHRETFDKLIEQHPRDLVLVFESAEGHSRIYRIESSGT